ncbi:VOC family protein [Actinokineospora sp. PR83]|uniref:VOC family protein n=1 Tax=Actinokineospora sp. PR83 TaxID=2884908 RepID=UPI0027E03387|nr:VOC family protein [Actinokineospora sp. PR83]MCG8917038.1 VOC family protein [Actinokineospora sp. PR83]
MEFLSSRVLIRPADRERSLAFYRDALGLATFREFPGGTVFFLGGGFLEVSGEGAGGSAGVALWLQVRDLAATVEELRGRGAPIDREPRLEPWGLREAWTSDPDGTRIHLVQVPADHPMRRDTR